MSVYISDSLYQFIHKYEICPDEYIMHISKIEEKINMPNKIIISNCAEDLIWLQGYKGNCFIILITNVNICTKVGKNVNLVIPINEPDKLNNINTTDDISKIRSQLKNIIYNNIYCINEIRSQDSLYVIGGCYHYGLMSLYKDIEDIYEDIELYIVKYANCNYCILKTQFNLLEEIKSIAYKYNFILCTGMPHASNDSYFPLQCPSDLCYTIEKNAACSPKNDLDISELRSKLNEEYKKILTSANN